jgi:hypothetical protein
MAEKSHSQAEVALSQQTEATASNTHTDQTAPSEPMAEVSAPFVGRWNRLTSTTNWEKGRIICQWRETIMQEGAPVTDYSDETWARIVGYVTSQHVGRLRRVYQQFGTVIDQYPGLFWSHFQAALDWEDAEMWLEGAIQNDWSISQMRGKRWETRGTSDGQRQAEQEAIDAQESEFDQQEAALFQSDSEQQSQSGLQTSSDPATGGEQSDPVNQDASSGEVDASALEPDQEPADDRTIDPAARKTARLDVAIEDLPDDIAEAFEQFKLAIIAQRRGGWREITPESVAECLDALKELALASG